MTDFVLKIGERWIECECPHCGMDWDEFALVDPDTPLRCSGCASIHRAGDIGQLAIEFCVADTSGSRTELTNDTIRIVWSQSDDDWRRMLATNEGRAGDCG